MPSSTPGTIPPSPASILYAFLNDTFAGAFTRNVQGTIIFTYDDDYRWSSNPTPLSLSLPISKAVHAGNKPEWFLDALLPESSSAREIAARLHNAASTQPFDLLTAIGADTTGALRLSTSSSTSPEPYRITPISDEEIGERLRASAPAGTQPAGPDEHWSVAGQQGKVALLRSDGSWFTASGSARTTHIIKPGIPGLADQAFDEHFTMCIARHLGLHVAETAFRLFDGQPAIIVTRFDRSGNGNGAIHCRHQIDLTQALGIPSSRKYEEHGGPLSQEYAQMLREHDLNGEAEDNVKDFVDGILASYLLGATDSHAKNYSLLLDGDSVRMAPLYDLASFFPYTGENMRRYSTNLAMTIGGQRKPLQLREKHLRRFAERMQLNAKQVINRFSALAGLSESAFDAAVEENRDSIPLLESRDFIDRFHTRMMKTIDDASWALRTNATNEDDDARPHPSAHLGPGDTRM